MTYFALLASLCALLRSAIFSEKKRIINWRLSPPKCLKISIYFVIQSYLSPHRKTVDLWSFKLISSLTKAPSECPSMTYLSSYLTFSSIISLVRSVLGAASSWKEEIKIAMIRNVTYRKRRPCSQRSWTCPLGPLQAKELQR